MARPSRVRRGSSRHRPLGYGARIAALLMTALVLAVGASSLGVLALS